MAAAGACMRSECSKAPTPELLNQVMERMIARLPMQYLWSYNRYKRPANVSAP